MSSIPHILEGAKKTLENANKFTRSVTGGKPNMFAPAPPPKAQPIRTDYMQARMARKAPEFMGVRSDQAPELNAALESREQAKRALEK